MELVRRENLRVCQLRTTLPNARDGVLSKEFPPNSALEQNVQRVTHVNLLSRAMLLVSFHTGAEKLLINFGIIEPGHVRRRTGADDSTPLHPLSGAPLDGSAVIRETALARRSAARPPALISGTI